MLLMNRVLFMKKEINADGLIYMIAIFMMPIITFIGVTKLQTDIINISDVIKVGASDYNTLFLGDMIIFITCWVALFISYVLYKGNIKLAQGLILLGSTIFLIYNIYLAINSYGSISSIINPLIVLSTSAYALIKPINKTNIAIAITRENSEKIIKDEVKLPEEEKKEVLNENKVTKKNSPKKNNTSKKTTTKRKTSKSDK